MAALSPPRENLVRALQGVEVRAAGDGSPARLSGHFAVFNTPTEIQSAWEGNFIEQIAPGAFAKTIRENGSNIKVLLEHGQDPQVGQKPLGRAVDITEDDEGARYDVELYDTPYVNELLPALRDGQYGASFRFQVVREDINEDPGASDWNPKGLPVRTIKEARVSEFGPVLWGAYPEATAQARSMTDEFMFRRFMDLTPDEMESLAAHWRERAAAPTEPTVDEQRAELEAALTEATERVDEVRAALDALTELPTETPVEETAYPAPADDEPARRDEAPAAPPTPTGTRKASRSYLNRKEPSWKLP